MNSTINRILLLGIAPLLMGAPLTESRASGSPTEVQIAHEGHPHSEVTGVVNSVDTATRKVNVTHDPVPSLGWPSMTMDFAVANSVDLASLKPGSRISFKLGKGENGAMSVESLKPIARR